VAARDDKITQCIIRSALFPGRANGDEAAEPSAKGVVRSGEGHRSPFPLGGLWALPEKKSKTRGAWQSQT